MNKFFCLCLMFASMLIAPVTAEENTCGDVNSSHKGVIPEWENDPVDFECKRGFSALTLCILNRRGVEALDNAGPQFIAVADGRAIYAITRENHPAYPMIVRREVKENNSGQVSIETTGCGYGDKAASDQLIADYKALDREISSNVNTAN